MGLSRSAEVRRYVLAYAAWLLAIVAGVLAALPFVAWSHHDVRAHPEVFLAGLGPAILGFMVATAITAVVGSLATLSLKLGWRVLLIEIAIGAVAIATSPHVSLWLFFCLLGIAPAVAVVSTRRRGI